MPYFKAMSQYLLKETEENHKQSNRSAGQECVCGAESSLMLYAVTASTGTTLTFFLFLGMWKSVSAYVIYFVMWVSHRIYNPL